MKKVCTLGSATQDIFILYEGADNINLRLKKSLRSFLLFETGTKIDVPKLHYSSGGGATNTAVGFKRLGFEVETFFKTGNDEAGRFIRSAMNDEQIDVSHCLIDPSMPTALSFILSSVENNQVALCSRSVNREQTLADFPLTLFDDKDLIYVSSLAGDSRALLAPIASYADSKSIPLVINPGLGQISDDSEAFIHTLSKVNTLIMNDHEAGNFLTALAQKNLIGKKKPRHLTPTIKPNITFGDAAYSILDYIETVFPFGPKTLVITAGSKGVFVAHDKTLFFCPSLKTTVVSSLGAGDAFGSAFVGGLLLEKSFEEAILFGAYNAASVLNFYGPKEGLLKRSELEQKVQDTALNIVQKFDLT